MGDRPNRDISWFTDGVSHVMSVSWTWTMIRLSKTRAGSRCKAKHLRHIRDRIAQSGSCVCAGFAHPVVLLHHSNVSAAAVRTFGSEIYQEGPQFRRHYREGAHKQTLELSVTNYHMHLTYFIFLPCQLRHC